MMSLVLCVERFLYERERVFPNFLVGDPTGQFRFERGEQGIDFQDVDVHLSVELDSQEGPFYRRELGFLRGWFYFPQRVEMQGREQWVLINKQSAQCWLQKAGVITTQNVGEDFLHYLEKELIEEGLSEREKAFVGLPEVRQFIMQKEGAQKAQIMKALITLFASASDLMKILDQSSDRVCTLQLCVAWGEYVCMIEDVIRRVRARRLLKGFLEFAYHRLRLEHRPLEDLVNEWKEVVTIFSSLNMKSSILPKEIAAIVRFIHEKQLQLVWEEGCVYQLFSSKETGLPRSVLFVSDQRALILLNRKSRMDVVIGTGSFCRIKTAYDTKDHRLLAYMTTSNGAPGSEEEQDYRLIIHGYSVANQIGEKMEVVSIWGGYKKKGKGGEKYIVLMELIEGENLRQRLLRGSASVPRTCQWSLELLEGLKHVHAAGVIHNDIKPGNVMIDREGHLRIIDFGFATEADERGYGNPSFNGGTHMYSAPQRFRAGVESVHQKHDVWAAGIILWQLFHQELCPYFRWETCDRLWEKLEAKHKNDQVKVVQEICTYQSGWMLREGVVADALKESEKVVEQLAYLIVQMLDPRLEERLTAAEAHARLQGILGQGAGAA